MNTCIYHGLRKCAWFPPEVYILLEFECLNIAPIGRRGHLPDRGDRDFCGGETQTVDCESILKFEEARLTAPLEGNRKIWLQAIVRTDV